MCNPLKYASQVKLKKGSKSIFTVENYEKRYQKDVENC